MYQLKNHFVPPLQSKAEVRSPFPYLTHNFTDRFQAVCFFLHFTMIMNHYQRPIYKEEKHVQSQI